ncbi:MAG TPA: MFS transporter, partial [Candidatus Competibacteraceae bacterium]|nr:MFS transporter [Candidatus Competibacteraceae bacterium]
MRQLLASIGALMLAVAMLMTASGLFGTFLGLRSSLEGFSKEWVGLLMSAHYGGLVLGALRCGRLINRIGHIRAFAAFCAMAAAFSCLFPFVVHPVVWVLLRSAIGFNMAGMFMVVESWLTTQASDRTRGTALSIYMMVTYLAAGSGPLLINLADPAGQELFLLAVMLFALALVPVAVTRTRAPVPVEAAHFGLRRLYAISPLAVIGCIGAGLVCGAAYGMGPVFAQSLGLRVAEISGFMSVLQVSGLLLQLPLGRLSDRYDRRSVLTLATLALALVSLAIVALMLWHSLSDIGG